MIVIKYSKDIGGKLVKGKGGIYVISSIQFLWSSILTTVMDYVSLDGRYDRDHSYHFGLLNHFIYNKGFVFPLSILFVVS